jgi:hypothetical protein
MKQQRKGVLLAGVLTLAFGLSACAQWKEWRDGGSSSGSSGSGSSGTTASSGGESSYRVMLRMDDGSTQVVTQDTPPTFRSGDRVSLAGGAIKQ